MSARESLNPEGSMWDLIAVQLRRHREERKMSGSALGTLLDLDRSSVSRLESGQIKLLEKHARKLDREWDTADLFTVLVRFAKEGHDREWFKTHTEMEARASELRIWELSWVPGLLQTESFTRAQVVAAGLDNIDSRVAHRMKRQEALSRTPPPLLWVILDEGVIRQPVGSSQVMRDQLAHLLALAALPNISIRIVPTRVGAHVGRDGSFKIMTVDGADAAYIEASEEGRLVVDATDVRSFRARFDRIGDRANPVDASIELIEQVMEGHR
ncbi:helix-turn-helix transcriptional regulator [Actinomadura sp. HBU206391]|uniref:helix-turn-helix domain-containing protein n=1 Tax=Actinomadura sp. HBU206391 TaxID=2731692 RepID=UPI00164F96E1|nr:helix-turn-helix transcriptional regulator [Actinomadura sp. HBU206391]MBC6460042.1 helix-turn-helix transcriptional regulator [Actinomadura sp. HBU206391]